MIVTVAMRMPATITGSASGSSTLKSICLPVSPIPRAASMVSAGTESSPATVLRIKIRSEQADHRGRPDVISGYGERNPERGEAGDGVDYPGHEGHRRVGLGVGSHQFAGGE